MKTTKRMLITAAILGVSAWAATAQDQNEPPRRGNRPPPGEGGGPGGPGGERGGRMGPGGPGGQRVMSPMIQALDANGDGVIDEKEIENASAALKKLDKNGDGKLTPDEYMPQRPGGRFGPGGPGMPGQGGGPAGPGGPDGEARPHRPPLEQ